ncbi:MAG: efflux RND transporter permease subunit [Nitrospirota bacterium]
MKTESDLFRRYTTWIVNHRFGVILAIAVVTALLASRLGSLKIDMDPDLWTPQAHPYAKATKQLEEVFGMRNVMIIGVVPKQGDVYQPEILEKIQRIQDGIETIPEANRRNTLSLAARKVKDIKGTADGMEVRQMLEPFPRTPEELARLKQAVASNPIYLNALVSPDGKAAAVIADFKVNKAEPSYAALYRSVRAVVDRERDDRVAIHLGGLPVQLAWFEFYMFKMPMYFGLALLIIMAIQYWSFRSFQGMLLPIVTALLSVVWGLGVMGLLGVHMDGMNTTTPILIMAVAAGHAIQILKRYYEEYHRLIGGRDGIPSPLQRREANRAAVVESLTRVGPVMLIAGVIAVITFYSLTTAGISVVRHFGTFAGSGILCAMILELTLIPALRSWLSPPKACEVTREQRAGWLDRGLSGLAHQLVGGRAPWILGAGIGLIVLAAFGMTTLRADNSLKRYNAADSEVRRDDAILNAKFGGSESLFFIIEGPGQDAVKDPKVLQGMATLQTFLEQQPHVGKTQSLADLIKRMNQAVHADDPAYAVIPDNRDLIAQYLFLYSVSGDPQDFDSFVDNDYQKAVVWVYLKDDSTAYAEGLYRKAQPVIAESFPPNVTVRIGGSMPQTMAINEVMTREKFHNMIQMAVVVLLLASLVLRSVVGGLFVVTPLAMVILANLGLMGWFGIPLDMGTATTASMAIGIGADYEIYLLFRFREELAKTGNVFAATRDSLLTSGKAILFVALSVAGGYSVLLTSGFGFYSRLAVMVIATMVVSALSAVLFLRAMMMIFKPRFIFGDQRETYFPARPVMEGKS